MVPAYTDHPEWPENFRPNLTPKDAIQAGIFGGVYFDAKRIDLIDYREFPEDWFEGLPPELYCASKADPARNRYGVMAGLYQKSWEENGWIRPQDPRGWFQWYCRYYLGRRSEDDTRQIGRWLRFAHPTKGRFASTLYGMIHKRGGIPVLQDPTISPVIRQAMLQWAQDVNEHDYRLWCAKKGFEPLG